MEKLGYITAGLDKTLADTGVTDKNLKDLDLRIEDRLKRLQNQLEAKVSVSQFRMIIWIRQ